MRFPSINTQSFEKHTLRLHFMGQFGLCFSLQYWDKKGPKAIHQLKHCCLLEVKWPQKQRFV